MFEALNFFLIQQNLTFKNILKLILFNTFNINVSKIQINFFLEQF